MKVNQKFSFRPTSCVALRSLLQTGAGCTFVFAMAISAGCGKAHPIEKRKPSNDEIAIRAHREIPGEIKGSGWAIKWYSHSTTGVHRIEKIVDAVSATGSINDPLNPSIMLNDVAAKIYQDEIQTGTVNAAVMTAKQNEKVLYGSGGVKIVSVTNPPDTVITGDSLVWDTHKHTLVITGNAHAIVTRLGRLPDTTSGEKLVFDTLLKEIRNE